MGKASRASQASPELRRPEHRKTKAPESEQVIHGTGPTVRRCRWSVTGDLSFSIKVNGSEDWWKAGQTPWQRAGSMSRMTDVHVLKDLRGSSVLRLWSKVHSNQCSSNCENKFIQTMQLTKRYADRFIRILERGPRGLLSVRVQKMWVQCTKFVLMNYAIRKNFLEKKSRAAALPLGECLKVDRLCKKWRVSGGWTADISGTEVLWSPGGTSIYVLTSPLHSPAKKPP